MPSSRPPKSKRERNPEDGQAAMEVALRLLGVRSRAEQELTLSLARKGFSPAVVDSVIARLKALGYLDDAKFARARASALFRGGRMGERGIEAKLRGHGLSADESKKALEEAREDAAMDPLATARQLLERRSRGRAGTPEERARDFRFLIARGFSFETAREALGPRREGDLIPEEDPTDS